MPYKITDDCTMCGACEPECPNIAISEGSNIYIIDLDLCTECKGAYDEPQCVAICPADCIILDENIFMTEEELEEKYKKIHGG